MKNGRAQAKDISDLDILVVVYELSFKPWPHSGEFSQGPRWVCTSEVADYFDLPWKVVNAKWERIIKRKLGDGCTCGCRGDFRLTEKGAEFLRATGIEVIAVPAV